MDPIAMKHLGRVSLEVADVRGNHLSNATCLTQFSSNLANNFANYDDPWHDLQHTKQMRLYETSSVRQVAPPQYYHYY